MKAKKALRAELIARRDAMAPGERDRCARELAARLAALPQYAAARNVLSTMSIGSSTDTASEIVSLFNITPGPLVVVLPSPKSSWGMLR